MNHSLQKVLSLLLCLGLCFSLCACGVLSLTEEEREELAEDDNQVIVGQSIGQELAATYAADKVFSLNSVSSDSFCPYVTTSAWNEMVGMLVYENLVVMDENFNIQPNLITSWSTEDGKTWTFTVDTSRFFHDGGVMTAADALYSFQIAAVDESMYSTRFRDVTRSYTVDTATFVVELSQPNFQFYKLMNIPCVEYGTAYEKMPPGTGPYRFNDDGTALELDESHPLASEMPLDTIYLKEYTAAEDILQAFEDSYLDFVINDPTAMSNLGYSSTNIIKYVDSTHLHYLGYNTQKGVFSNTAYRVIMTYVIDRASIVSDCMSGAAVASTVPIHPSSTFYPTSLANTMAYSPSGFEAALENVGIVDVDGDGEREFSGEKQAIDFIVCSDSSAKVSAARSIVAELDSFGITVNLREMNFEDYMAALENGNFDIYYGEVKLCLDWDISLIVGSGGSLNYGNVWDSSLDSCLNALHSGSEDLLEDNIILLCQYLAQSAPITPICFEKHEVLYHRGVLSGLTPTQDNFFYGMENWNVTLTN